MKEEVSAGGIVFKKLNSKPPIINPITWLICQHSHHKGWVFPKGLVGDERAGEPMEEAAVREVLEEGGVEAAIITKLKKPIIYFYKWDGTLIKKTVHFFLMEYISGDPKDHDHEMMDAKFVTEEEVRQTLTYKNDKGAFEESLKIFRALETSS